MPIRAFPDPRNATPEGIVAFGGDFHTDTLVTAYRSGIFPWPIEGMPLPWFCPPERAIIFFQELHLPRSLRRAQRQSIFRLSVDEAFPRVIRACANTPRIDEHSGEEAGTWITPRLLHAYLKLHVLGYAHSVEAWHGEALVGGIYGVSVDGTFSAESMFHLETGASKMALLHLIEHLRARGLGWLDVQVLSPHVERLGARTIPREQFLDLLRSTQARQLRLFDPPAVEEAPPNGDPGRT